jgi:hypothetical protein
MSRLDYLTIAIVIVCVLALGFLVYRTIGLMDATTPSQPATTTETTTEDDLSAYEGDTYNYDDEGEVVSNEVDLDDEDIATYEEEEEISDEPLDEEGPDLEAEATTNIPDNIPDENESTDFVDSDQEGYGDYLVLAGSYSIRANAESEVRRLKKMGYDNTRIGLFNGGAYAGVLVDRFENLSAANTLAKELKGKGLEVIVQKKR